MSTRQRSTGRYLALATALALGATACGGSSSSGGSPTAGSSSSTGTGGTTGGPANNEGTPQKGGTLNMLGSGDTDYLDANISYYTLGALALRMFSRQLYTYPADPNNNTKGVPDLATGDPKVSSDGKTVTISIQKGAMWDTSPPRQITAADEVRGVKRTCNPAQPFGGLPDYQDLIVGFSDFCAGFAKVKPEAAAIADYINKTDVAGVTVGKDPQTVVFKLNHPAAYFTDMLTMSAFSPAPKEYDKYVPASGQLAQHTVSDGPYKLSLYKPTKRMEFVRNDNWDAATDNVRKAYVDRIIIDETVAQESSQQQLQTGTPSADMTYGDFPPPSVLSQLIAAKDPQLTLGPSASSNPYVVYNTVSPNNNGALGKVAVRQAISYATNRDNIIQALGGPKVNPPLTNILPKALVGGEQGFDPYPYNVSKAKEMLKSAGFPNGMTLKFLYRPSSEGSRKSFATIQQDLKQAGITVKGVPSPDADFYTKYLQVPSVAKRGVWDLSLAGWGSDWYGNAALSFFNPLFSGPPSFPPNGSNYGFYQSTKSKAAIDAGIKAKDESQAGPLWAKADHAVMADAPIFPITQPIQALYRAKQVKNAQYIPSIQGYDPTNVWLDPATNGG